MNIIEALTTSFIGTKKPIETLSNNDQDKAIDNDLTNMDAIGGFSILDDNEKSNSHSSAFDKGEDNITSALKSQSDLITEYRRISRLPEIGNAIDEIVNESVFEPNSNDVVFLDFGDGISENLQKSCIEQFDKTLKLLNMSLNADMLFRRWYIDGRLALNLVYDNNDIRKGIQKINLLTPFGIYYDNTKKLWCYSEITQQDNSLSNISYSSDGNTLQEYKPEEIAYSDSGIYDNNVILSHLHPVIKVSNQLQTLEDLLIPLRFSRSISRRVFNIDVGDLSYSKGLQAVKKIRDNFKYKKYYDVANGRISNSSTIASIVEDYFLPKRSEGKGSNIDVLEETGNLGETGDLEYFQAKLAKSLKVPLNRLSGADGGGMFDFTGTQIENEEKKFFAFIHRLRNRFNIVLLDILKYQLISTNTMNEYEWRHYQPKIFIKWVKTSNYLQRQHIELFKNKMELYSQVSENIGELYSKKWVLTKVLGFSDQEILEMKQSLLEEEEENLNDEVNKAANKPTTIDNVFDEDEEETTETEEPENQESENQEPDEYNVDDTNNIDNPDGKKQEPTEPKEETPRKFNI